MNENYTPEKWTKKRYEQCVKELCEVINTQNEQLQAYKDKEDKLREYIEELKKEKWQNDRTDYMLGISYVGTKVLQILNEGGGINE